LGRGNLRTIRRRIDSTLSTGHIAHAMEMVAKAKENKIIKKWRSYKSYVDKLDEIVRDCFLSSEKIEHPLTAEKSFVPKKTIIMCITSDMGLCGAYNLDLLRLAEETEEKLGPAFVGYFILGTKGLSYLRYKKKKILYSQDKFYDSPDFSISQMISDKLLDHFDTKEADSIMLIWSRFRSSLIQKPEKKIILPVCPPEITVRKNNKEFEYEPQPEKLFDSLLPLYVKSHLLNYLLEAKVSELFSRENAMRNATENADNLITRFTREYNKARQASITQEIIEIVNGAEALKE